MDDLEYLDPDEQDYILNREEEDQAEQLDAYLDAWIDLAIKA